MRSLRQVSRSFRMGRQEDAHEYARCLIDRLHEDGLKRVSPKPSPTEAETGLVSQIFGLRLRSRIRCTKCEYASDTFEPAMDLSLEVLRAKSLEKALASFTAPEKLDGSNKYMCPVCKSKQKAVKQFTVDKAPNVLTVQLKRFDPRLMGGKIDRRIDYPAELDLGPSTSSRERSVYRLFAVLVHAGRSVNSGHYFCFTKSPAGVWLECDDSSVHHASERTVLSQKAYMLFYVRESAVAEGRDPPLPSGAGATVAAPQKAGAIRGGPVALPGPSSSVPQQRLQRGEKKAPAAEQGVPPMTPPPPQQVSPMRSPPESPKARRQIITRSRSKQQGSAGVGSGGVRKKGSRSGKIALRWQKMLQFLPMRMQLAERLRRGRTKLRIMQRLKNTPPLQAMQAAASPARTRSRSRSRSRSPSPIPARTLRSTRNRQVEQNAAPPAAPQLPTDLHALGQAEQPRGAERWTEQIKNRIKKKEVKKPGKKAAASGAAAPANLPTTAATPARGGSQGVEQFLMGDGRRGQYGVDVPTWGGGDDGVQKKARALIESQRPSVKARDPYEEDYDRGKLKKVRKPKEEDPGSGGNAFQKLAGSARGKFGGRGSRRGGGAKRPAGKRTGKPTGASVRPRPPRPTKFRSRGGGRGGRGGAKGGRRGSGRK